MFFRQMTEVFLVLTEPASSMVEPAHIHITSAPHKTNEKVLSTKRSSSSTAACAGRSTSRAASTTAASATAPSTAARLLSGKRGTRAGWRRTRRSAARSAARSSAEGGRLQSAPARGVQHRRSAPTSRAVIRLGGASPSPLTRMAMAGADRYKFQPQGRASGESHGRCL